MEASPETALYLYVDGKYLVTPSSTITTIYDKYKSDDGFLYITYANENTFG